jgi:hypothetical protein
MSGRIITSTANKISAVGGNAWIGGPSISASKAHDLANNGGYIGNNYISANQAKGMGFK